jgi:hypothetical protein
LAEQVARLQHVPETLTGFKGVNLRVDRLSLRDEDCARALNVDFHSTVGSPTLRKGRTVLRTLSGGAVRRLLTAGPTRYSVSGATLYAEGTSLVTSLDASLRTALQPQRPLTDPLTWVFVADDSGMKKTSGGVVRTWGVAAPTAAPTLAAGAASSLSGVYTVSFTYVRKSGTALCHESNPSPTSLPITITSTNISVTGLTDSSDAQVTHKRIYRTVNGGSTRLLDQEIAQGVTTATLSVADTALGAAVETDNDLPPTTHALALHQEHLFLLDSDNPDYLWWTKRYRPESVPAANLLRIGTPSDPLSGLVSLVGLLGVFTPTTKYRILGNATSGFVHQEALSSRGTPAPQAAIATEKGCFFVARDGLFRTNFVQEDEELSGLIAPLFEGRTVNDYDPINWSAASTMALGYWKQRLYFAYPSGDHTTPDMLAVYSFHTNTWYFYQYDTPVHALYNEEATDLLLAGGEDGTIASLETGSSDNGVDISAVLEPATGTVPGTTALGTKAGQTPYLSKRFDYLRPDVNAQGGTVLCEVYHDDVLRRTIRLIGARTRQLQRLPGWEGQTWRVRFSYTGTEAVSFDGVTILAVPLRIA